MYIIILLISSLGQSLHRSCACSHVSFYCCFHRAFLKYWLTIVCAPEDDYVINKDRRQVARSYRVGLESIKESIQTSSRPSTPEKKDDPRSPSESLLAEQLSILPDLPRQERLSAAYEIIHSHFESLSIHTSDSGNRLSSLQRSNDSSPSSSIPPFDFYS